MKQLLSTIVRAGLLQFGVQPAVGAQQDAAHAVQI
jgi:hypothetical protein